MSDKVERLVVLRRRWLAGSLVGVCLWMVPKILVDSQKAPEAAVGLTLLSLLGAAIWGYYLLRVSGLSLSLLQDKATARVLEDELVRSNRTRAAGVAFIAVILLQGVFLMFDAFAPGALHSIVTSQATILIGTVAFVGAFLYLDAKE